MNEENFVKADKSGNYLIDQETNIVINKNVKEYDEYKMKIEQAKEIERLKSDMNDMKTGLLEIKDLLRKALG